MLVRPITPRDKYLVQSLNRWKCQGRDEKDIYKSTGHKGPVGLPEDGL
jgi:hypothetical protein